MGSRETEYPNANSGGTILSPGDGPNYHVNVVVRAKVKRYRRDACLEAFPDIFRAYVTMQILQYADSGLIRVLGLCAPLTLTHTESAVV